MMYYDMGFILLLFVFSIFKIKCVGVIALIFENTPNKSINPK